MRKSARLGCQYVFRHRCPHAFGFRFADGAVVKVVKIPGGSMGGSWRHVQSNETGEIDFVPVQFLHSLRSVLAKGNR